MNPIESDLLHAIYKAMVVDGINVKMKLKMIDETTNDKRRYTFNRKTRKYNPIKESDNSRQMTLFR